MKNFLGATGRLIFHFYSTASAGKSSSSVRWLKRQSTDPVIKKAKILGYRSRAAIKLEQMNKKHCIIKPGNYVIDLGAAPGGWTQVAVSLVNRRKESLNQNDNVSMGCVIAMDILDFEDVPGAVKILGDFREPTVRKILSKRLNGRLADTVLSDMAPSLSGVKNIDQHNQSRLCINAIRLVKRFLKEGGNFVIKSFAGGSEDDLRAEMKTLFREVITIKPPASRKNSSEIYYLGKGFLRIFTET